MKYKYITIIFVITLTILSCTKHEILFDTTDVDSSMAEFQFHYFAPVINNAANYIDSVFVNGVLYSSVKGSGQLIPYNGVPGGATGRFFAVKSGNVKFTLYRGANIVYDYTVDLKPGKQNIFVYDFTKAPIVFDNGYPYIDKNRGATISGWDTDSICTVRFYNFLYETATTPYPGKIQYQYQHLRTKEWVNLGAPVGFGQATERVQILIVKSIFNSSGYQRVDYRMLDENGEILRQMSGTGAMINYSDYWTGYIGRSYMHIFGGVRTASSPAAVVQQWGSL
jgi:hypothetical protein